MITTSVKITKAAVAAKKASANAKSAVSDKTPGKNTGAKSA
ncbi:MAG: hypothetical protein WCF32_04525 [Methanoregula sp.]